MSERLPEWAKRATSPSVSEAQNLDATLPEPLREASRRATDPSDLEVQRLVERLEAGSQTQGAGWGVPRWVPVAGMLAVAAVALWWLRPPVQTDLDGASVASTQAPPPVAPLSSGAAALSGQAVLGPSIEVVGLADLTVGRDASGAHLVLLHEGATRWSVEPRGADRALTVRAGEVDVRVVGTIFEVMRLDGLVVVEVERGTVSVDGPGVARKLTAAEGRLELPDHRIALAQRPGTVEGPVAAACSPVAAPSTPDDARAALAAPPSDPAAAATSWTLILDRIDDGEDPRELATAIEAFIATHGGSVHAADAHYERLVAKSRFETAWLLAPEIAAQADADPDSRRWLDLWMLHATVARDGMQDCTTALPSYRKVASHATGTLQGEAEAWRGLCAARVGFESEALGALARSIQLGVTGDLAVEAHAALDRLTTDP